MLEGETILKKPTAKRLIGALAIALLISVTQPITAAFIVPVCVVPVLISILYAWAGWIPAAVASVGTVLSLTNLAVQMGLSEYAGLIALGCVCVLVLPAVVSCVLLEKRQPFFRRMAVSVFVQTAMLLGCVAVIYLGFKVDLVDAVIDLFSSAVLWMPEDAILMLVQNFAMTGMLNAESMEMIESGFLTGEQMAQLFAQAFDTMRYLYKLTMPAMLMSSSLLTGVLMTTGPGLICARRGDEPQVDYLPMSGWFMPSRMVGGLAVCLITGYALQWMEVSGAEAAAMTISTLCGTALTLQGIAALSRGLKQSGRKRGARIAMILAGLALASTFVQIAGAMSALFGRKGAISGWMRKRMEEKRKEDDEQ